MLMTCLTLNVNEVSPLAYPCLSVSMTSLSLSVFLSVDDDVSQACPYVYVNHTGNIRYDRMLRLVTACNLQIFSFPFDVQNCTFTFGSYMHTSKSRVIYTSSHVIYPLSDFIYTSSTLHLHFITLHLNSSILHLHLIYTLSTLFHTSFILHFITFFHTSSHLIYTSSHLIYTINLQHIQRSTLTFGSYVHTA